MEHPNELETQENILKPSSNQAQHQKSLDQKTLLQYEQLSYFEKEEIIKWLINNLSQIPMFSKTKKAGLKQLLTNNYEFPEPLAMIRHAIKTLHPSTKKMS